MYVVDFALTAIERMDGPAPAGPVVLREALVRLRDETRQRTAWLEQARAERDSALETRARAERNARTLRETTLAQARELARREAAANAQAARQAAVMQAVDWLVDEALLERKIVCSLERRIAQTLTQALTNFVESQDVGARIAQRVARALPSLVREGALVLRVPPAQREAVATALRGADIVLACEPDETLAGHQARLESEWVTVCLDLEADLAAVVERLQRNGPSLEVANG
ncbi:hypothetical protein HUS70_18460 [Pandoraea nosoerga]|uniref:Type III secretion system apparatus protein n=1 Tax=Pandoraea nosoerga TaxID=2508296 RepID=A0A5E4XG76_9BURK|nr:hypothetical protein [Pandoraea nosoerga]MBN4668266.1 hypothetical protein [Pandoraea nosoerga]MBN4677757.1 hypothetical protein [Pandoraea nosoerga]MBN4682715.1 hypothetical protein [Pandoraea nosoerga]MBN4746589.1 hypothetical protein [Pandoraea nosoerga]VVE35384.1 type III secretion system apparatus protein [Pandoraea nosoerga]